MRRKPGRVKLGEVGVFDPETLLFGDGFLKAKAIDDRAGCAALLKLAREELPMDCTFVFSTQEEVGTRGAFASSFSVKPEIALVLEATTAADLPGTPSGKRVCVPGNGVVIPYMDGGTIYDRRLFEQLRALARRTSNPLADQGIPVRRHQRPGLPAQPGRCAGGRPGPWRPGTSMPPPA